MKTWQGILFGTLLGGFITIILGSVLYQVSRQPQGKPVELLPAPTLSPLVVQVAGEVKMPGLYDLPRGSRVQDAVEAAGGFTAQADQAAVNLAARLKDGEKITVPALGSRVSGPSQDSQPEDQAPQDIAFPIDLNSATLEELDALPGIGSTRAEEIVRYREEKGGFKSIEELKDVTGIGEGLFNQLKEFITVEGIP